MENIEENPTLNRVNELVESVRQRTRSAVDLHRRKLRSDQIDASRLNLKEFSEENVSDLAQSLKSQKHARINQLHDLSQAFLQSVDNIACFMNVTGAINVIVKELTSNCYDTQILAAECVCNLSLGTEIPCEKLAHQTTSYLLTFLRSSDERLLRTSLWTITNLLVSGEKPRNILKNQEIMKCLLHVLEQNLSDDTREELHEAIAVAVDGNVLKDEDRLAVIQWISNFNGSITLTVTLILYKILDSLNFRLENFNQLDKLISLVTTTIISLYKRSISATSIDESCANHLLILLRILSNCFALNLIDSEKFIQMYLIANEISLSDFLQHLFVNFRRDAASRREVLWFARNLIENERITAVCLEYFQQENINLESLVDACQ